MNDEEFDVLVYSWKTNRGLLEIWRSSKEEKPESRFRAKRILKDEVGNITYTEYIDSYIPVQM